MPAIDSVQYPGIDSDLRERLRYAERVAAGGSAPLKGAAGVADASDRDILAALDALYTRPVDYAGVRRALIAAHARLNDWAIEERSAQADAS